MRSETKPQAAVALPAVPSATIKSNVSGHSSIELTTLPSTTAIALRQDEIPAVVYAVVYADLTDDQLCERIEKVFVFALRLAAPDVREVQRRFNNLDRSKQLDGTYRTIRGCLSFQAYCETILHRSKQAVYAMLCEESDPKPKTTPQPKLKPVKEYQSLIDAVPVIRAGQEIVPPSRYSVAEIEETVTQFTVNLVSQLKTAADRKTIYRSLVRKFDDLLGEL